jgi:hypothetical protein
MDENTVDTKLIGDLKKPLPEEAVTPHPTKSYLSNIKAIYVVERLNEVFGIGGWKIENTFVEKVSKDKKNDMVVMKAVFTTPPPTSIYIEAYGGNDNEDLGDAYKGACTDALTKIGSYLGIGMDVFKGLAGKTKKGTTKAPTSPATGRKVTSKQVDYIVSLLGSLGETKTKYEEKIKMKLEDLSSDAASKCIETLKGRIDKGEVERDEFDKQVLEEIQKGDDVADEYKYKAD